MANDENDENDETPGATVYGDALPVFSPVCAWCMHWEITPNGRYCRAFPRIAERQIPDRIWTGADYHLARAPEQIDSTTFQPPLEAVDALRVENAPLAVAWEASLGDR